MRASLRLLPWLFAVLPFGCSVESTPEDDPAVGGAGGAGGTTGGTGGSAGAMTGGTGGTTGGTGGTTGGSAGTSAAGVGGTGGTGGAVTGGTAGTGGSLMAGNGGSNVGGAGTGGGASGMAGGGASSGGASGDGGVGPAAGTGGGAGAGSGAGGSAGQAGSGGGAGAGGSAGSSGGASGFDPCPTGAPCKILPLGDSITDGIGFSGGYRVQLFHLALQAMKQITFVGGSMNGPNMVDGQTFPKSHEGHSGWTIAQIDGIVPSNALNPDPHIILLHIGTNDMYGTPAGAPDRLGALIDQILTDQPNSLLVVSTIIPFPGASGPVNTFNAAVPGVVNQRKNAGKHILLVDQFTGFPTGELGDGVHPNQAGYTRMAGVWFTAIQSYLK